MHFSAVPPCCRHAKENFYSSGLISALEGGFFCCQSCSLGCYRAKITFRFTDILFEFCFLVVKVRTGSQRIQEVFSCSFCGSSPSAGFHDVIRFELHSRRFTVIF